MAIQGKPNVKGEQSVRLLVAAESEGENQVGLVQAK